MKRPLSVTLISLLFIAAGTIGIIYHRGELKELANDRNVIWIFMVRLMAIVGGVFALRGANWARWLLVAWIFGHVILSFFHTSAEVIMHAVIMAIAIIALSTQKQTSISEARSLDRTKKRKSRSRLPQDSLSLVGFNLNSKINLMPALLI